MKKFIGAVISLALIGGFMFASHLDNHYTRQHCYITNIENNILTIEDMTGNIWEYQAAGYKEGEIVNLKMNSNHTDFIEDDKIEKIERA